MFCLQHDIHTIFLVKCSSSRPTKGKRAINLSLELHASGDELALVSRLHNQMFQSCQTLPALDITVRVVSSRRTYRQ